MTAEEGHFLRDASHVIAASKLLSQESHVILDKQILRQNTAGFLHNYVSPSITNFPEIEKNSLNFKGKAGLLQQSLSKIPYFSSVPGRNMVSIVDLIDLENSKVTPSNSDSTQILSKVNLLSTSNTTISQKIDDDLFKDRFLLINYKSLTPENLLPRLHHKGLSCAFEGLDCLREAAPGGDLGGTYDRAKSPTPSSEIKDIADLISLALLDLDDIDTSFYNSIFDTSLDKSSSG
jgi:hypothetical protein